MKRSEIITTYRDRIEEAMLARYRNVLTSGGRIQYKLFIWEDGELEGLAGPQGDDSRLQPGSGEPRALYYVCTIGGSYFDPWDVIGEPVPEDEAERTRMEQEAIDGELDEYETALPNLLDAIIIDAKQEEDEDERYDRG